MCILSVIARHNAISACVSRKLSQGEQMKLYHRKTEEIKCMSAWLFRSIHIKTNKHGYC